MPGSISRGIKAAVFDSLGNPGGTLIANPGAGKSIVILGYDINVTTAGTASAVIEDSMGGVAVFSFGGTTPIGRFAARWIEDGAAMVLTAGKSLVYSTVPNAPVISGCILYYIQPVVS